MASKMSGLKEWCNVQTQGYGKDIANFSSSFNDGLALCALSLIHI